MTSAHEEKRAKVTQADLDAAKRLRQLWDRRPKPRISQQKVGEILDMGQSAVNQYLSGKIPLGAAATIKWANYLKVSPTEIRDDITLPSSSSELADDNFGGSQSMRPDAARLRSALSITERELIKAKVSMTPEAKADVVVAVYDLLVEGYSIQAAERTVTGMLRAFSGVVMTR